MARGRNHVPTVTITLSTTPQVRRYLVELVSTGLYGKNAAEAAERLVTQAIDRLRREGGLPGHPRRSAR